MEIFSRFNLLVPYICYLYMQISLPFSSMNERVSECVYALQLQFLRPICPVVFFFYPFFSLSRSLSLFICLFLSQAYAFFSLRNSVVNKKKRRLFACAQASFSFHFVNNVVYSDNAIKRWSITSSTITICTF